MIITFASCLYEIDSKFSIEKYIGWLRNFLSICNDFNLVFFTDERILNRFEFPKKKNVKVVILPQSEFINNRFEEFWIQNHDKNIYLNHLASYRLNILYSEKVWFVKKAQSYFNTEFYGWCDAGYFRNPNLTNLKYWPNHHVIKRLNKDKIHYGLVHPATLEKIRQTNHIPPDQVSIAGGFFIVHSTKIDWWISNYYETFLAYKKENKLIKDDQILIVDCVVKHPQHFQLHTENNNLHDNWFMFQRLLGTNEKISILLPIFNGYEFFNECFDSIINQTYPCWDLLIGINGHDENSDIYQQIKKKKIENKIIVFDLYYLKGKVETLHFLVEKSDSRFIALIDVDDIWEHNKLEVQVPFMMHYDVVGTRCVYFQDSRVVPKIPAGDLSSFDFKLFNPMINSSVIIRKELCLWEEYFGVEDYELWLRLRLQKKKFFNCEEILVHHRIHNESFFNSSDLQKKALYVLINKYKNML